MKTKIKFSSFMHLFTIISCAVIAVGMMVGTICHFVANGFFNYSDDWANYKSISVKYEDIDFSGSGVEPLEKIQDICVKAFDEAGISSYVVGSGDTSTGGNIIYKFVSSTDGDKLDKAVNAINEEIKSSLAADDIQFSYASLHEAETFLGGMRALIMCVIAISCCIVLHFLYFLIRFKLSMALGALTADVHNLALFVALLALCRVPVGPSVLLYAVLTVVLTMIGTCFVFDRMRKNFKDETLKKLSRFDLVDKSASESFMINMMMTACLAGLSVIIFVLMSISSLSPLAIISSVLCSLVCFIACAYGTVLFTPAVYSRYKLPEKTGKAEKTTNVGK